MVALLHMCPRKRYAIFDLDGTLLDTEPLYTVAIDELLAPYGRRLRPEVKSRMMGREVAEAGAILINALQLPFAPKDYVTMLEPILRRVMGGAAEIPGAGEFVAALAQRGVGVALATSSHEELALHKLAARPLRAFFRAMVFGDDARVERPKPAPDILLEAAQRIGAEPAACVVFEDSLAGAQAARAAGMEVVVVAGGPHSAQHVPWALAHVPDFRELDPAVWFFGVPPPI